MTDLEKLLAGSDLRSIGNSNAVVQLVKSQADFDGLFKHLFHTDRVTVMHTADAVEKITVKHPHYLAKYEKEMIDLTGTAEAKELKWHLALLLPRLPLNNTAFYAAWNTLVRWAKDASNSRIVRVNAIQGLFELSGQQKRVIPDFNLLLQEMEKENLPSVNARIRKIRKYLNDGKA